jgi:hypothetical protein
MGIFNKRNAVIGWLALKAGKGLMWRTQKPAASKKRAAGRGASGAIAAIAAAVLILRRRKRGDASEE